MSYIRLCNLYDLHHIFSVSILVGDSDHDEGDQLGDNEEDTFVNMFDDDDVKSEVNSEKTSSINFDTIFPAGMLFFIIYGPYAVGVCNFDITSCL